MVEKSRLQGLDEANLSCSQEEESDDQWRSATFLFYAVKNSSLGKCATHSEGGFSLVKDTALHRHIQRLT